MVEISQKPKLNSSNQDTKSSPSYDARAKFYIFYTIQSKVHSFFPSIKADIYEALINHPNSLVKPNEFNINLESNSIGIAHLFDMNVTISIAKHFKSLTMLSFLSEVLNSIPVIEHIALKNI
jgi:hypothetical protein